MPNFRLDSLSLENFRSISGSWTIPLDAQVILVHGPNGAGKTSLLSAIELAATGGVSFLDGQSDELHDVLLNRNYPLGRVQLRLRSADATTRSGSITLDSDGLSGTGALNETERLYFRERCFLPQTALGRLLETYTATGKQVDTALVRFVKTVVGLDDLDNLIDGLHPAGHLARTRAASAGWKSAEADRAATQESRDALQARFEQAEREMTQAGASLRALIGRAVEDIADGDLPQYVSARVHSSDHDAAERNQLESLRVRLEGSVAAYTEGFGAGKSSLDSATQAETAARATAAYNNWETGDGARALTQLNNIRAEVFDLAGVSAAQIFEGFEDAQARARELTRHRSAARQRRVEVANLREQLTTQLDGVTADVARLEAAADAIDVPPDVRVLLDLLERTIPLAITDVCPICDQLFSEGEMSLRQHLEVKAASLSRGAQELMYTHDTLRKLRINAASLTAELDSITVPREDDAPPEWLARALNSFDETVNVGLALLKEVERTADRKAEATSQKARQEVANRNFMSIRGELGIDDIGLQFSEEAERLADTIEQRSQASLYELHRRTKEDATSRLLEEHIQQVTALSSQIAGLDEDISNLQARLKEAHARKEAANALRLDTEKIRSSVINQVFDQTLNTLWADLFGRFVPSEPFVPRFRKQKQAKRTVDIHLETVLPNGEVSGAPSAMLSYGNTNTAALSLFIALHLSSPTELPWLIFDDPVQSMDDIHVANFATVVRQLSYAHDRQVVIAVHQQELFEYLALELAPATGAESLLKVSLNRRGEVSYVQTERIEHRPEPSLTRQGSTAPEEG